MMAAIFIKIIHFRAQILLTRRGRKLLSVLVFASGFLYNLPRFFDSCIMRFQDPCTGKSYDCTTRIQVYGQHKESAVYSWYYFPLEMKWLSV